MHIEVQHTMSQDVPCQLKHLLPLLERPPTNLFSYQMSLNVFVSPHSQWINIFHDPRKVVKFGVNLPELGRRKWMRFGPMRTASVPDNDRLEGRKKSAIRY